MIAAEHSQGIDEYFHGGVLEADSTTLLAHGELASDRRSRRIDDAEEH